MLAPLVGRVGADFRALNLFVSAFGVAGVLLLYLLVRARLGWPLALLVALAVWLNPRYQQLCNTLLSDVPGTTLALGCLWLERWSSRRPTPAREALLGAGIALAASVRVVNLLLLPAIVAARLLRPPAAPRDGARAAERVWRQCGVVTLAAGLLLLPWFARNQLVEAPPIWDQTALYSYTSGWLHVDKGDPASPLLGAGEIAARTRTQGARVAGGLACRLQSWLGPRKCRAHPALAIPMIACLLLLLVRRRAADDFFAVAALLAVVLHFGFQDRLLLPVWVLMLPAVVEVLRDAVRRAAGEHVATAVAAAAVASLIALDFAPRSRWGEIEARDRELRRISGLIAAQIEPGDRVGSAVGSHYAVFLERDVYSLKHAVRRAGGRPEASEAVIDAHALDVIALSESRADDRALLPYFEQRHRSGATRRDDVWVFRVQRAAGPREGS